MVTFLDTPGFDGYQAGGGNAKETEEILQLLEEHLAAKGSQPITHVLVFLNANDMCATDFKGRARRTFERLFANSKVVCITTRWDLIEGDDGLPVTPEEARSKEQKLYASGRTSGSLLEYLHDGRGNQGGDVLHFRSGLPIEAYSSPQDIIHKLVMSDNTLEERLAAMTKERDDLATKYNLLLQKKDAPAEGPSLGPKEVGDDSTTGPKETVRTLRSRRQRLLDTIDNFSAQMLTMMTELDKEALDVPAECKASRRELEAASSAVKVAEARLEEELANVKAVVDEYSKLRGEQEVLKEQEKSLTSELDGLQSSSSQSPVRTVPGQKQRLAVRLKQTQAYLEDTDTWMTTTESDYKKGCQRVEQVAAEIEKLKLMEQGKERELNDWLFPESRWLTKERENFQTLQESISTELMTMRNGLNDSWEGKLGDNSVFLKGLGDYTVNSEMVAQRGDWAPVIDSFYESLVSLALSKEMSKFHSAILQRLKTQEDTAQQEYKKGVEAIFGQRAPELKKSLLPPLVPLAEVPGAGLPQDLREKSVPAVPQVQALLPPPLPLEGHTAGIMSVVFSWDGAKIISGSTDKTVRIWDASTGKVQRVLDGHSNSVTSVAISGDGSWIASGSDDRTVRIWNAKLGTEQRALTGHTAPVKAVAFSYDGSRVCSGGDDMNVRVWTASTWQLQKVLTGHTGRIVSLAMLSRDGRQIASGAWDMRVMLWDASTTAVKPQRVLTGHTNGVSSLSFSGNGTHLASASYDQTAKIWDLSTGKDLRTLAGHKALVTSVAFSPDGTKVVSGAYDNTLRLWDALSGNLQSVLKGHTSIVWDLAFSSDGQRIASAAFDNTVRVWDPKAEYPGV
ncbi:hypothetical protein D9611_006459 [Ephemerocybe angulata]|uniref:Uncharacterized protein n=1 Tax=Ephemerocybe angulata TaxID=980116 RepID=A0A8H5FH62_9AGAR|nr:hypothetical protein D9611_006459 [Tulosesus angulatus]